jgi:hypothetical protein
MDVFRFAFENYNAKHLQFEKHTFPLYLEDTADTRRCHLRSIMFLFK